MRCAQPRIDALRCRFALRDCIDNFFAAVRAVTTREILLRTGAIPLVNTNCSVVSDFDAGNGAKEIRHWLLANGTDDHIHLNDVFTSRNWDNFSTLPPVARLEPGAHALDASYSAFFANDPNWLRVPVEKNSVQFCKIVLVTEGGHFLFATPINQVNRV